MIEVKDLIFKYPGQSQPLFEHFSLNLEEGKIYGLLGKNGTGKSTLLYLLTGLLRPKSGTVVCDGHKSSHRDAEMLQEMFLVPEEFKLPDTSLNGYLNVIKPFYPKFSLDVLNACLDDFELSRDLHLGSLSMGEAKKVFMSVALASNAKYLLMDEPTNGLDIPSKSQFRKVVARQMSEGQTLIISTHQVHDVETLLDHILILNRRELLLDATVQDIIDRYVFELRMPGDTDGVIYAEPSLQGNIVMAERKADSAETQLNLELLFNAITKGLVK